ncbi:putative kinesin-like protein KIF9 [Apostichopus japonicus]|uniref:Putative kinesin-like protein KIF9 n=1 Tax=Stichopus japonicus TaxID=307972 RepID=A0A2G8LH37_STIJA|nr:putative kinesin-like protein KIF9 [Apostichopus japonicus]
MCYGQTGAGKTFTMTGATEELPTAWIDSQSNIGSASKVYFTFKLMEGAKDIIPGDLQRELFDLLSTLPEAFVGTQAMTIIEDEYGVSIKGLALHIVTTKRKHLTFFLRVRLTEPCDPFSEQSVVSVPLYLHHSHRISFSDRLERQSEGKTQQEAMYTYKSLTFLEQTIVALADRRREHIPYRQTKLTHALKDSLGGNCETIMIANIWGEAGQIEETISTLRFATRMMCISINPGVNEYYDPALLVKKLEKEIKHLKHELGMHDTLANRSQVSYEALSDTQLMEIENQVRRYMEGSLEDIDVVNVRQVQAVFDTFKNIVVQMENDAGVIFDEDGGAQYVGEVDGQGFGLVLLPPAPNRFILPPQPKGGNAASPVPSSQPTEQSSPMRVGAQAVDSNARMEAGSTTGSLGKDSQRADTPPLRTVAFEEFKKERGSEINRILMENKEILASKKTQRRDLTKTINLTKQEIDEKRLSIEQKRQDRQEQGEYSEENGEMVISEEEFQMIKNLKELKASYRTDYQEMRQVNSEIQYCQKLVDQCRQRLISEFDNWYSECFLQSGEDTTSAQDGVGARPGTLYDKCRRMKEKNLRGYSRNYYWKTPTRQHFTKARIRTDRRQTLESALEQAQPDPPKRTPRHQRLQFVTNHHP